MLIIPAVDLMEGKCVRLIRGDPRRKKVYYDDPLEAAELFFKQGARILHLVDLDAALMRGENFKIMDRIVNEIPLKIQVAGGIRSLEKIEKILEIGAFRVVLGTVCIKNPSIVKEATRKFGPSKIMAAIDLKEGAPAYHGWKEKSSIDYIVLARNLENANVGGLIFTCVDVDGTLSGVSLNELAKLKDATKLPLIASGGISNSEDIKRLESLGIRGVIIGKALYEGRINLREVMRFQNAFKENNSLS